MRFGPLFLLDRSSLFTYITLDLAQLLGEQLLEGDHITCSVAELNVRGGVVLCHASKHTRIWPESAQGCVQLEFVAHRLPGEDDFIDAIEVVTLHLFC